MNRPFLLSLRRFLAQITLRFGIQGKLILIFLLIKVIPLILLAWLAILEVGTLGQIVGEEASELLLDSKVLVEQVSDLASENSIKALDRKSQENIENLTTTTAQEVADFLYERDSDILLAARLEPSAKSFADFLSARQRRVVRHRPWQLNLAGDGWEEAVEDNLESPQVWPENSDNRVEFHYRPPVTKDQCELVPLYFEMTYVGLDGRERYKATTTDILSPELLDVAQKKNTWCNAETYFSHLEKLRPGEIYVSEVVGPYVSSPLIGPYTKARCLDKGIPFAPQTAAYAGKENPVGRRFQGLIRWATPVVRDEKITGYVTLALDHTHIMEFTDHLVPTEERFSEISDAASGNYAFMWDYLGRNISHPRDYFIVGYDPETGERAVPWLDQESYDAWQASGLSFVEYQRTAPVFNQQSLKKRPARELTRAGMLALDGRYLNFAPQCSGWNNLTQHGGSGSFVIYWSNLWKLTTAATIPYYTGIYKDSPRGFGYVTIGANVEEFHRAASDTAFALKSMAQNYEERLKKKNLDTQEFLATSMQDTVSNLTFATFVMIILVFIIAIWMASFLTSRITTLIKGIKRFRDGDLQSRLKVRGRDEMADLARAFNAMTETLEESIIELEQAREAAEELDRIKGLFLANMSHEIRTPINGILGLSNILLQTELDQTQKKHLETLKISADRLLVVINDILDFSKMEAGKMELVRVPFNLNEIIDSILLMFSLPVAEKGLLFDRIIDIEVAHKLVGDPNRLQQIIINLVNNALKFTESGSILIKVEVLSKNCGDDHVVLKFSVVDTGVGIHPTQQKSIFNAFDQADDSHTRNHGGSGLGLAISSDLVKLMDGEIGLESQPGAGSIFWFTAKFSLPGQDELALAPQFLHSRSAPVFNNARVLLAEDEEVNVIVARAMLEQVGIDVTVAGDGYEVLELVEKGDFHLIFMDIQMPGMDGFMATAKLREQEASGQRLPIIAMTAHAMQGYEARCLEAGMDDYLSKPFTEERLYQVLQRWLSTKVVGALSQALPESRPKNFIDMSRLDELNLLQRPGKPDMVVTLLNKYLDKLPLHREKISLAFATLDAEKLMVAAHTLKSSSAQLGATRLAELCAEFEDCGREGCLADIEDRRVEIENEIEHVIVEFERIIKERSVG